MRVTTDWQPSFHSKTSVFPAFNGYQEPQRPRQGHNMQQRGAWIEFDVQRDSATDLTDGTVSYAFRYLHYAGKVQPDAEH